ncbi:MAG: putative bifunctional diguanylate cyclase/phosphodiesterase [Microthrixaceae bacterium]
MDQAREPVVTGEAGHELLPELEHLRALLADTADLAAVADLDGTLRFMNRAGYRLLALIPDLALGSIGIFDLVAPGDQPVVEQDILPALHADGWWTGNLAITTNSRAEIPTRSTLRVQSPTADGPSRITWIARDISTERAVYERLHKKIFEDELTGLPHRSIFLDRIDLALRRRQGEATDIELLFISLARYKEKNDRFGRDVGDQLLRAVARRLESLCGAGRTVSRWGGDEFVILYEGHPAASDPMELATTITLAFTEPFVVSGVEHFQTASIGVATARAEEMATDVLLRQAEAAGQMAKQRGGGVAHRFDESMRARAMRRAEVEDALRGAADRGELVLHYQPEVCLRTNKIVAVEALVRWQHPDWGLVAPAEFVPVSEASSLILEVGAFVLAEAMNQCARWRSMFPTRAPSVAINISGKQFLQDDFVELVASVLAVTGADPADLCLEITESILMDDVELTVATLRRLKALGVQLAVDDFGTGYSSLSYLRRFPVDILKVDQSFVSGLGYDPEDSAIVQAVVAMGRALQLTTVAEGVETAHHLIELRELDCDIGQGYHFARPGPAENITRMLESGTDWMRSAM